MKNVRFVDFFKVDSPNNTKVKFNINAANPELPAWDFLRDDNPEWINLNAYRTKHANNNLDNADYVLSFAQYYPYGPNYYIFGGMYKVKKIDPEKTDDIGYELTLMDQYAEYIKRLIIRIEKPISRVVRNRLYSNVQNDLEPEIYELAPYTKMESFPGYTNVLLTHKDLRVIVNNEAPEWKTALSSVKGIYVITDAASGQLYIGSAYGNDGGIWQRWSAYGNVKNLTGNNKTFEELKKNSENYIIDNFTYAILEIFDMRTKREDIIKREEYWKRVFQTVKYGMNNVK